MGVGRVHSSKLQTCGYKEVWFDVPLVAFLQNLEYIYMVENASMPNFNMHKSIQRSSSMHMHLQIYAVTNG